MTENSITNQTSAEASKPAAQEDGPEPINQNQFVDYALLLKPRVMSLVLFTGIAGMLLSPGATVSRYLASAPNTEFRIGGLAS